VHMRTENPLDIGYRFRGEGSGEFVRIIRHKVRIICTGKTRTIHAKTIFGV